MTGDLLIVNTRSRAAGSNGGFDSIFCGDDAYIGDCNISGCIGIRSANTYAAGIGFATNNGTTPTGILRNANGTPTWNNNTIWHAGNDGSGSGLDADVLDGKHYNDIINGNVASATHLQTARFINGSSFDGTSNITTASWGTTRTLTLSGNASGSVSINGGSNVTLSVTNSYASSAGSATVLATARTINGTSFNGSANITTSYWGTARTFYINSHDPYSLSAGVNVNGNGDVTLLLPNTIKCSNWFRSTGKTGWLNDTYGGGIYMTDSTYVKVYYKNWFRSDFFSAGIPGYKDDSYGIYNATGESNVSRCCYAFVREGTRAFGMGYNTSNEMWLGLPNPNKQLSSEWLRIGSDTMTYLGTIQANANVFAQGAVTAKKTSDARLKKDFDYRVDYRKRLLMLGDVVDFSYNEIALRRKEGAADKYRQ